MRSGKKLAFFLAVLELGFFSFLGGGPLFAQDADTQEPAAKLEVSQESYIQEDAPKAVSIPIPKRVTSSFFALVDKNAVEAAEIASPESLKRMSSILHRSDGNYSQAEKTLIVLSGRIMQTVWPSVQISWNTALAVDANPYLAAFDSAERGIYDTGTGSTDFFGLLLPAMLVVTRGGRSEYGEECLERLTRALALRKNSVLANYMMGLLLMQRDKPAEALVYLNAAAAESPETREILFAQAQANYKSGNYQMTVALCSRILSVSQQYIPAMELLTHAYHNAGEYEKAENYVLRVLQLEPENLEFVLLRAEILMNKGDYIKASSLLDVYARNNTGDKGYLLLRAKLQRSWNKNNSAASETLARALKAYPEDPDVLLAASQLASDGSMMVGGRTALELAEKALEVNPGEKKAMAVCIAEMNKNGDWEAAYEMSSRLVAAGSTQRSLLYDHVDICLALDRKEEAWTMASALYEQSPGDEEVQQTYLKVLVSTKRRVQASAMIDSLMKDANARMKSFLYYQKSLLDTDQEMILSDLRSSLTANPRNRDSLYRLYRIYYERKDWRRAQYYLKQVVALNPSDTTALALNAELDNLLGR